MKSYHHFFQKLRLILFTICIILFFSESLFCQDWYDTDWQYRRAVTVDNPGGTILTDFQIQISLDNTFDFSEANPNGSDLVITADDGTTLLPLWIESWDATGQLAHIWIKISSIPIAGTSIFMYYGNINALSISDGALTFDFFDDFNDFDIQPRNWIRSLSWTGSGWSGFVPHDWKYSMILQEGALYYSINRLINGWSIESLDSEIEEEFDYLHNNINFDGTVDGLTSSNQYEYGVILSNLSLGYLYFKYINPILAARCYNDMENVYEYVKSNWQSPSSSNFYSITLRGYTNAWTSFNDYGNITTATEVQLIIEDYGTTFLNSQNPDGSWSLGSTAVQTQEKRNLAMLWAYDITGLATYLDAVKLNMDWILANRWISANGGLTWTSSNPTEFYESHQQWFMIATRMLYDRSGGAYDYLAEGQQAWHFLTDNNYANIDLYVHNYENHNAFFSYRDVKTNGSYQTSNPWKASYENGVALWGMAFNYEWLSNYQSVHSAQAYNYLDELAKQLKKPPSQNGFFADTVFNLKNDLWSIIGNPIIDIIEENGNHVLSLKGHTSHNDLITSVDNTFDNFIFESKVKMTQDVNDLSNPEVDFRYIDLNNRYLTILRGVPINDLYIRKYEGGAQYINSGTPYIYTTDYYKYKIAVNAEDISLYLNESLLSSYTDTGTAILSGGISLHNYRNPDPAYFDDIRIRKYTDIEPNTSIGEEQSQGIRTLDLKVYLEGPFNGVDMETVLTNLTILPLNQPYNTPPWNYSGTESLIDIPNPEVVDWMLIELRDAPDAASATPATQIARQAALLLSNGNIVGLDGVLNLEFNEQIAQQLFIVVWHRNHLGIMSANALTPSPEDVYMYDFTTDVSQAYNDGQKDLEGGNFGMMGGDINANNIVDETDISQEWIFQAGTTGYLNGDIDLDGQVNNPDKNEWWYENLNQQSQVPE